jgi:hypothetical protein
LAELEALVDRSSNTEAVGSCNKDETLLAVNLLVQFFFRELRSQGPVRRFLLRRINQEMEEVLTRGAVSKIIKGLKVVFSQESHPGLGRLFLIIPTWFFCC